MEFLHSQAFGCKQIDDNIGSNFKKLHQNNSFGNLSASAINVFKAKLSIEKQATYFGVKVHKVV